MSGTAPGTEPLDGLPGGIVARPLVTRDTPKDPVMSTVRTETKPDTLAPLFAAIPDALAERRAWVA
jgi:hypothetical protein